MRVNVAGPEAMLDKLGRSRQGRRRGGENKRVLRPGGHLFRRSEKAQCFKGDKIIQGGTQRPRLIPRFQQVVELADRKSPQIIFIF